MEQITVNNVLNKEFKCFPFSHETFIIHKSTKQLNELENADKIIIPEKTLNILINFNITSPYCFKLVSNNTNKVVYCSVAEFTAPDKTIYIPTRIFNDLHIVDRVDLVSVNLPAGKKVKFNAPLDFLQLSNPQVILEKNLRNFSILSLNMDIYIHFVGDMYNLTVSELDPGDVVHIIDTDLHVEFEKIQCDYKPLSRTLQKATNK